MTKITTRALNRKFEQGLMGKNIRRKKPIEAERKVWAECSICFKPIYVSPGQLIKSDGDGGFSHKTCRKTKKYLLQ